MNMENYLQRIGIEEKSLFVNEASLRKLQRQHLLNVAFENLDIHWKRLILLDTERFYKKIVQQKRGGFCYELNGLFCELLNKLGFYSTIISARVSSGTALSAEYSHLALLTKIGDEEFLVDVGFGDFTAEPLRLITDIEQTDANGTFSIRKYDENYYEVVKKYGEDWQSEYIFKDSARDLQEFAGMCNFHQTSPESHFTRGKVCSLMTRNGRKTLTDNNFIETKNGKKTETEIDSPEKFDEILAREFRIQKSF